MGLGSIDLCGDGLDWSHQKLLEDGNMEEIRKRKEEEEKQVIGAPLTPLRCPRCDSKNTKFCYYNNYSKSQPRHFCKSCRRHWTNGGTLRNVPVGGSRKSKKPKLSHPSANGVRRDQISEDDNIGIDMIQSKHQVLHQEDEHHQHIQQFPLQFVPNLAPPHPPTSSSSPSDYNSSTSMFGRNGSIALGSLLSSLPPILSPLMDPFFLANNSSLSLPQPTSGFLPLMKLMEENGDDQEDKFGLTNSSSMIDAEVASTVPWQSTNLLPMCSSSLANVSSGLELSSTEGGGFWNCWDEFTGFSTPQANHDLP